MKIKLRLNCFVIALLSLAGVDFCALADDTAPKPAPAVTNSQSIVVKPPTTAAAVKQTQGDVASKTAVFGKITATDDSYKTAVDAHALADAMKLVDKDGAFKGKVAKVFEPRGLAIIEFDANYKTALTAVVRQPNFANFPALTNLVGKDVWITGKFIQYREAAEIVLEKPEQIKVVEPPVSK